MTRTLRLALACLLVSVSLAAGATVFEPREFGSPGDLTQQKAFFESHIATWTGHFFADLEAAKSSVLYAALGTIGRLFVDIEETAFSMT